MDPDNPIVRLCVAGMKAESDGRNGDALAFFSQAWEQSTDDFEASIAAHYVARHQKEAEETLRWNQIALARAEAVGDAKISVTQARPGNSTNWRAAKWASCPREDTGK